MSPERYVKGVSDRTANRCMNQMAQIESEFGLTPSARTRIRMEEQSDTIDPFEEYLRGGKQLDLWRPEKT